MTKKQLAETTTSLRARVDALSAEVKRLTLKLAMSNSAFLNIVGKSLDGVIIIDQHKMVVYSNYAAIRLFDRNIADLLGEPLDLNFNPIDLINSNETTTELHIPRANNEEAIAEVSVLKTEWNNEQCYVVSFRDITERKKTEEMLKYMSTHDYLTDLPNRAYFEKQIEKAIEYAKQNDQYMALLYVDLDDFKTINDTLGHGVGDELLKTVSSHLQKSVRRGDTVARLGGDEFAVILTALRKVDYAANVSRTILDKLGKDIYLDGKEVYINASIGIAIFPFSGTHAVELLKNADTAMYVAKTQGKNRYQFYSADLERQSEQELQIINGLRNMIHNKELCLQYQPIIELEQLTCSGIEALVRWNHPQLGLLFPHEFLLLAEEAGLMGAISQWVIHQATDDYKRLPSDSFLFISINLSGDELIAVKTTETILSTIQNKQIQAHKLVVELTENTTSPYSESLANKFRQLSKAGIQIAVDYCVMDSDALNILKQLPVALLKIDKSLIDQVCNEGHDRLVFNATVQLAHDLGLKVVAEGVESKEQLVVLKEQACDYAQGFYLSKPLDIDKLIIYLQQSAP